MHVHSDEPGAQAVTMSSGLSFTPKDYTQQYGRYIQTSGLDARVC